MEFVPFLFLSGNRIENRGFRMTIDREGCFEGLGIGAVDHEGDPDLFLNDLGEPPQVFGLISSGHTRIDIQAVGPAFMLSPDQFPQKSLVTIQDGLTYLLDRSIKRFTDDQHSVPFKFSY